MCSVTYHHNLSSLNNLYCYLIVSMGQEPRHCLPGSSARGLTRLQSRLAKAAVSSEGLTGEESTSKLNQAVGRVDFLYDSVIEGCCWLLAQATLVSCRSPYVSSQAVFSNLTAYSLQPAKSLSPQGGPSPSFKGLHLIKSGPGRIILL